MTSVIMTARCARVSSRLAGSLVAAPVGRRVSKVNAAAASPTPRIRYTKRPEKSDLFLYTFPPPITKQGGKLTNLEPDEVSVILNDLRNSNNVTLHRNGFELVDFPSGQGIDWEDEDQVRHC